MEPQFVLEKSIRSDSDNGLYINSVLQFLSDYKKFSSFKRDKNYREILEHVSFEQGLKYYQYIMDNSPEIFTHIQKYKINDLIGDPISYNYPEIGEISPTTLRYLKVAIEIKSLFGNEISSVAEIGVGYGGQLLISDNLIKIARYTLLDLDPVLMLAKKYLEHHDLNLSYSVSTLNMIDPDSCY